MNQPIGELSPPFEIAEPASWRAPIIFNSPHSGSVYPPEFLKASRIDMAALRRSEDSFMDELIGGMSELGFATVAVHFPRPLVCRDRGPHGTPPPPVSRKAAQSSQSPSDPGARRLCTQPPR